MADISKIEINGAIFDLKDELIRYPSFVIADEKTLPISGEALSNQIGKIVKYLSDLKDFAYKNTLTFTDVTNALDYIPLNKEAYDEDMVRMDAKYNVAINRIYNEIVDKGSRPASKGIDDICLAIENIPTGGHYGVKEIREDGTYYPSDDGVDAYSLVVVSKDVGEPHTVVFYDIHGDIVKTQANVPYHGNASCTIFDGTTYNGQYFKGWNPAPTNIIRDTFCEPIYGDYIIDSGEIQDDWETICSKCGADYPLGSYKSLVINVPAYGIPIILNRVNYYGNWAEDGPYYTQPPAYSQDITSNAANFAIQMVKVAEGEDGSTSTWISKTSLDLSSQGANIVPSSDSNVMTFTYGTLRSSTVPNPFYGEAITTDWGDSGMRRWFNEYFSLHLPECIQDTLKTVEKRYMTSNILPKNYNNTAAQVRVEKSCLDKVWIPSMKELHTFFAACSNYSDYSIFEETSGINYATVIDHPPGKFMTRTVTSNDRWNNPIFLDGSNITPIDQRCGRTLFGFCL